MIDLTKEDQELDDLFHGEEKPLHPDTVHMTICKPAADSRKGKTITVREKEPVKDAPCEPEKPAPNHMDKLMACAKSVLLFGGLSFLIFYWNEAGLMADSVAVPSIAFCTAMAGFGVGKNAMGRVRG